MSESIYKKISEAILNYDQAKTVELTKKAIAQGLAPNDIIDNAVGKTLSEVGNKFRDGELFLPQVVAIASCVTAALDDVLNPAIHKSGAKRKSKGRIIIGTVEGDVHDIGKSIVAAMLIADGFEVYDIGKDITAEGFMEKIKELEPDIVGASAMLTETRPFQREIALAMKKEGLDEKIAYLIGGVAADEAWAEECNATFSFNCVEAVKDANKIMSEK